MKIVADRHIPGVADFCAGLGELELVDGRAIDSRLLRDADALLVRTVTPVGETLLAGTPVKFVGSATSGTDHVDGEWLAGRGIRFASAPGCNARSVAEYVLSALVVCALNRDCDPFAWRVGIVGAGHTGSALGALLSVCGIGHLLNDPPLQQAGGAQLYQPLSDLHDVAVLSFHVPLTGAGPYATRGMLGRELLARLRDDVIIVNTSRGGIVEEPELIEFLASRPRACAVLDVWPREPDFNPALAARAAIRTPHIAGYSIDGRLRATQQVAAALRDWLGEKGMLVVESQHCLAVPDTIDLGSVAGKADALCGAVLAAYDVRRDVAAFDAVSVLAAPQRAAGFLALRNDYHGRREFPAHTIRLQSADAAIPPLLRGLGFQFERA